MRLYGRNDVEQVCGIGQIAIVQEQADMGLNATEDNEMVTVPRVNE